LEFAAVAWSPWLEADKAVLEKIQQRAVSMVSGLKGTTYEEKLKELGLTSLEERRHQIDMTQTFKIIRSFDKVSSSTWFQHVDTSVRTTRSAADPLNLKPQAVRLDLRRNFFSNRAVDGWNLVPSDIKNARTVHVFKKSYQNTERRWWEPPNKMQRMDPAIGEYHNKNKTLPKRFYLDHRKSLKYTQEAKDWLQDRTIY
jgi:ribonuclease P/MRP protein subunit RPP40